MLKKNLKTLMKPYQVLSDEEKRQKYDRFGSQWKQYQQRGGARRGFLTGRSGRLKVSVLEHSAAR